MLCYQYTRNATDIIHDTFSWITSNGRVIRLLLFVFLPICILAEMYSSLTVYESYAQNSDLIETLFRHYLPFDEEDPNEVSAVAQTFHYILLGVVVVSLVPVIRHYFVSRKSVKKLTFKRMAELTKEHFMPTITVAVLSGAAYFLTNMTIWTVILPYLILFFAAFPVSNAIMRGNKISFDGLSNFWLSTKYMLLMSFVVIVLQILPLYCCGIVAMVVEILNVTPSSMLPAAHTITEGVSFVMGVLSYLAFCYSMVVLFVSLTLFHGAVVEEEDLMDNG